MQLGPGRHVDVGPAGDLGDLARTPAVVVVGGHARGHPAVRKYRRERQEPWNGCKSAERCVQNLGSNAIQNNKMNNEYFYWKSNLNFLPRAKTKIQAAKIACAQYFVLGVLS